MAAGVAILFEIADWTLSTYTSTRTWHLFEGTDGTLMYLMGLTDTGDVLLTVILRSPLDIYDEYRVLVFNPALDAIAASG